MSTTARERIAGLSLLRRPGAAPPFVLLHGIGSDAESWSPLLRLLDPARAVIAWDAPGYGGSDALAEAAPTPQAYATKLAGLLEALGIPRAILVGHSLGALFAARFAAGWPDRMAAVALISPALGNGVAPEAPL
ncbi:MAG TPA: alpha/beta fold hydrolase, partial [Crenalkalicoccus sp.]|nr:alpha/beta fold hydrolase [Crenalkalicoccus sp.]